MFAIGMKHLFKTTIDRSAQNLDKIYVSGGQRGMQIIIKVEDLIKMTEAQVAHITYTINLVKYNIVIDFESMNHNHLNGLNLDITVRNKTPHKKGVFILSQNECF